MLANIHMDIEDYIGPSYVTDSAFRAMWAEFEWYHTPHATQRTTNIQAMHCVHTLVDICSSNHNIASLVLHDMLRCLSDLLQGEQSGCVD